MISHNSSTQLIEKKYSEYLVLARKYRPKNFDELIGHTPLITILSNSFEKDSIAHAFILHGVRGIGKTTIARIIAKSLNCIKKQSKIDPCGICKHCQAIEKDSHVDVIEMDAASRTGIDDIRQLLETIPYTPTLGLYKVYIIDEVHMLSKSAFNGILKILEEPPLHVKFILGILML